MFDNVTNLTRWLTSDNQLHEGGKCTGVIQPIMQPFVQADIK